MLDDSRGPAFGSVARLEARRQGRALAAGRGGAVAAPSFEKIAGWVTFPGDPELIHTRYRPPLDAPPSAHSLHTGPPGTYAGARLRITRRWPAAAWQNRPNAP